jgi:hypothetical protein
MMETEIIDKLFLELSQFTTAKTKRELDLEEGIEKYLKKVEHSDGGYWECQQELKQLVEKK